MSVGACSSTPVNIIIKARVLLIKVMILYTNAKLEGIGRGEMEGMNKSGLNIGRGDVVSYSYYSWC